ncbi:MULTISPECIES: PTS sugar transporter subunit IIA [Enterococcus]|uniref:PTS sugar transporter subunit IIA n=1 Tax=Enterococcus TaxID=1350 RepID=UPI0010FF9A3D|nr:MULTISPECIES: PTS sugar transporter subunit IIA [Enterococcus]QCT91190.1 PTS sugar transporter subunit IIA [Enterococcus sp. M190262]GMG58241.1 PTS sugar transporter subunit IIA [Enterococcus gallinarum]
MSFKELFKPELMALNMQAADQIDFFSQVSDRLLEQNVVKETFKAAISERENNYPTGLQLENFTVAIPHTDVVHVKEAFVAVNRLSNPIDFYQMGTDDVVVPVKDILVLGIKDPKKQVGLLAELMGAFADPSFVEKYEKATTIEEITALINQYL